MKDYVKIGLAAFAGYLIGFYEFKYKVMKVMAESAFKEKSKEDETQ